MRQTDTKKKMDTRTRVPSQLLSCVNIPRRLFLLNSQPVSAVDACYRNLLVIVFVGNSSPLYFWCISFFGRACVQACPMLFFFFFFNELLMRGAVREARAPSSCLSFSHPPPLPPSNNMSFAADPLAHPHLYLCHPYPPCCVVAAYYNTVPRYPPSLYLERGLALHPPGHLEGGTAQSPSANAVMYWRRLAGEAGGGRTN